MFKILLYKLPVAVCGLMLGTATLSNFFFTLNFNIGGYLFLLISILLTILFCTKCCIYSNEVLNELSDQNIGATFPTFTMTIITSVYIMWHQLQLHYLILVVIWWCMVFLQFIMICWFCYYHFWKQKHTKWIPNTSWFVTFVGIGVISETAIDFNRLFGKVVLCIAAVCCIVLLLFILHGKTWQLYNNTQLPMVIILAAPVALCLNAYLTITTQYNNIIVVVTIILSQCLFILTLYFVPQLKRIGFVPTFSALTFPWVTTAMSLYSVIEYLPSNFIILMNSFRVVFVIETLIATIAVIYVFVNYARWMRLQILMNIKE